MIYFIQNKETKKIKIGYTKNGGKERLKSLQTSSAERLVLLGEQEGTTQDEIGLHERFNHLRVSPKREWFEPGEDLMKHIGEINKRKEWIAFIDNQLEKSLPKALKDIAPDAKKSNASMLKQLDKIQAKLEEMRIDYMHLSKRNCWSIMEALRSTEGNINVRISTAYNMTLEEIKEMNSHPSTIDRILGILGLERKRSEHDDMLLWDDNVFDELDNDINGDNNDT